MRLEEKINCGGAIASCPWGPALEEGSAEWSELAKSHWESCLQKSVYIQVLHRFPVHRLVEETGKWKQLLEGL